MEFVWDNQPDERRLLDLQLNSKLALVSGSTAGIGLAIATALAHASSSTADLSRPSMK
jgi:NADP-dependent 3-hydroxy acid dehydrogenase YdfG